MPLQRSRFSALQRAENSSIDEALAIVPASLCFSALQRAENSSMRSPASRCSRRSARFSALQRAENSSMRGAAPRSAARRTGFSALQRAENSSIHRRRQRDHYIRGFQCSSASRKFLNSTLMIRSHSPRGFSALQRAENSSITSTGCRRRASTGFSALQRAENSSINIAISPRSHRRCFSALQRAENSSISITVIDKHLAPRVSVLFSEPKIPQSRVQTTQPKRRCVSVDIIKI